MSEVEAWLWLAVKLIFTIGGCVVLYALAAGALVWLVFFIVLFGLMKAKV